MKRPPRRRRYLNDLRRFLERAGEAKVSIVLTEKDGQTSLLIPAPLLASLLGVSTSGDAP